MSACGGTLLRLLLCLLLPAAEEALTAICTDDWALARGHRYGTVMAALECHRPVALFPNGGTTTVSASLKGRGGSQAVACGRADIDAVS